MKYKVVLEPQDESGHTVYVPALPGCVSQGETSIFDRQRGSHVVFYQPTATGP